MKQPGVEVRPIVQPDGTAEFNEVFFDGARCPKDNVVGGLNNGWQVANTTLGFERGSSATTSYRRFEKEWELIRDRARETGAIADPVIRQRLMKCYTTCQIMKVNGWRSLTAAVHGKGTDSGVAALGVSNKMFWSEYHRDQMELAMDLWGMEGLLLTGSEVVESWPGALRMAGRDNYPVNPLQQSFFFSRSETIWGGTAEIQRNIVGERVLGLPREPRPPSGDG
jgi:alkylation response protein AidB-like acyl-CoA dehydrogenase